MDASPTQSQLMRALRSFLIDVLPSGTDVIAAQANRVPEPASTDFVLMTPKRFDRLSTNINQNEDSSFTASIAGTVMTVTDVAIGTIDVGATLFGTGVAAATKIAALGSGAGGVGTYTLSISQTVASEKMSTGQREISQTETFTVQLDFHSADMSAAHNMAQVVSTLMRDDYGVEQFANQSPNYGVVPLYADNPRQAPFFNEAQQYEWRWIVEATLEVDPTVIVPQQFADSVNVVPLSVDVEFPT